MALEPESSSTLRCETLSLSSVGGKVAFQEIYHTAPVAEEDPLAIRTTTLRGLPSAPNHEDQSALTGYSASV